MSTKPKATINKLDAQRAYAAIVRRGLIELNRATASTRTEAERQEAARRLERARAALEGEVRS